ncbi:MAG: LysE family translocator [Bacteroidales bacterium]
MESMLSLIFHGLIIGILLSAPMGPTGALCIQRTLNKGRWAGFFTGLGASFSDLVYAFLTGFGMSFVIDFIEANQDALQIAGSLVLAVFATYLIRKNPVAVIKPNGVIRNNYGQDFMTGFFLTLSNPLIIFLIIGLFARFTFINPEMESYQQMIGFASIFLGAFSWWLMITFFVSKVRSHFNLRSIWLINRVIGFVILTMSIIGLIFGIYNYIDVVL